MKFQCETKLIKSACASVSKASSSKATIPTLMGLLLSAEDDKVVITGYDLEFGMTKNVEANVSETGAIVLNAGVLNNILSKLIGDTVTIETIENETVRVRSGRSKFKIKGINAEDFPEIPTVNGEKFSIVEKNFKKMIDVPLYAVAEGETTRPISRGLNFDFSEGEFVTFGVDGHRLAVYRLKSDFTGSYSFTVPKKALKCISKELSDDGNENVEITLSERHICFETQNCNFFSRLLSGERLDYKKVIPKNYNYTAVANVDQIISSINCCSPVIENALKNPIVCEFNENEVKFSASSMIGSAEEFTDIEAEKGSKDIKIGFNPSLLGDAFAYVPKDFDNVVVKLVDSISPLVVQPQNSTESDESFLFLVLPMRISQQN